MRGKPLANFPFDAEIDRTLHTGLRQARLERIGSEEEKIFVHSDSES